MDNPCRSGEGDCEYISDLIRRSALSRQRTRAVRCARLEGWPRVRTLPPSFETLASQAPQDEVSILHGLGGGDNDGICFARRIPNRAAVKPRGWMQRSAPRLRARGAIACA